MNSRIKGIGFFIFFIFAAFPLWADRHLVIFHTNDVHGYISAREATFYKENPKRMIGGFGVLANVIQQEQEPKIWLDSGDFFFASPEGNMSKGESVLTLANTLGLTAMAVGNHEFDFGPRRLEELAKKAKFPFLSANVRLRKSEKERPAYVKPYIIKEVGGVKVGIIGLITPRTPLGALPKYVRHLKFLRPVNEAAASVKDLREQGCELVIAVTHIGLAQEGENYEDEKYLAAQAPGLDVILGGHSHTRLSKALQDPVNKTIVIQSGSYLTQVGRLELWVGQDGKVSRFEHRLMDLWVDELGQDPRALRLLAPFKEEVDRKLSEVVGETKVDLTTSREGESLMGDIVADCIKETVQADIGIQNSGGIRTSIPAGPMTLRHLYNALPFENTIYMVTLTGSQVKDLLEASFSEATSRLQVSGLMIRYDMTRPKGHRLIEVLVNKKPVLITQNYVVATNNFLADGGDGYKIFLNGASRKDTRIVLRDAMTECIKKRSPLKPALEGRLVDESR